MPKRLRTRKPGSHLMVSSTLIRSWEWPQPPGEWGQQLVAVEVEGNVPVGGGELLRRLLDDGRVVVVTPQIFHVLLVVGPFEGDYYEESWSYPTVEDAMEAARVWDGEGEPPNHRKQCGDGDKLINSAFNAAGSLPIPKVEGDECTSCYQKVGEEHQPYCEISENSPGLALPYVFPSHSA